MADVRISQLDALRDVADDDILIVNDKSDGNKTKITRKKDLLYGISRNITDDGLNAVVNQDLIVNNDILLDGDIRTTGSITFGMLKDYTEGTSVLGFINDAQSILTLDSVLPTAKAIREYVSGTVISMNSIDSNRVTEIVNTISDSLNQLIIMNDSGILSLNERITRLGNELNLIDSDYILSASASIIDEMRTRIELNDSGVSVLAEDITALSASLSGYASGISANAGAISEMRTRIDANSDGMVILSQLIDSTGADFTFTGVDSDFVINSVTGARNELVSRIEQDSDRLSIESRRITDLFSQLELIDSDFVTSATSDAFEELSSRIDRDSDGLSIFAARVTNLEASLTEGIDSDLVLQVLGGAVENLETRINRDSDRLTVESQKIVDLSASYENLADSVSANGNAFNELKTRIDVDSDKLSIVSSDITNLTASIDDPVTGLSANASAVSALTATVDDLGNASAVYALNLDVNNHIAGIRLENDGSTADFVITADTFKIVNASNTAVTPFAIDGSNIALNGNVTINGTLSATQLVGDVAEIYSFSRGSGAGGGTVGTVGLTVETQEIYIPPPTGGVSKRPFIDGRIILSPSSSATYQNYVVEIRYISGPTFETTLTGFLGGIPSEFSGRRNYARYSGNYTDRVVSGGMIYTASDDIRSFYGANYDVTTNETLFLYDDDDGPIGNNATWMLAPSSATDTTYINIIGTTSGGGTGENARISNVVIPFSGILPSTTAPQGITLAITWKTYGYAGSTSGYLRSLEATYGYQR